MDAFTYTRVEQPDDAVRMGEAPRSRFIAGGTDLLNLMRDGAQRHDQLIDINALPLRQVQDAPDHLRLGALSRMGDVAVHPAVQRRVPMLSEALLAGASPQVRNMASIGGNLLQRTRCWYFRDATMPCNKREPGTGCSAIEGQNRWHAVLGGSDHCIAVHPSDLAVSLTALDAGVNTLAADGPRSVPIREFYVLPGDTPHQENVLAPGELITSVDVPVPDRSATTRYLKLRDRASFEFAVVSVAAVVQMGRGVVQRARLAFGGVAPRPWRSAEAEEALVGRPLDDAAITVAGRVLVRDAVPRAHNAFKVGLVQRALAQALHSMGGNR